MLNITSNTGNSKSEKRKRQRKNKRSSGATQNGEDKKKARIESKIKKLTAELLLMDNSSRAESCLQTLIAIKSTDEVNIAGEGYRTTISKLSSEIKEMPSIRLQAEGLTAQLKVPDQQRKPLLLSDLRAMVQASFLPMSVGMDHSTWCQVKRRALQLIVVVVEGVSLDTFSELSLSRAKVSKYYQQRLLMEGSVHYPTLDRDELPHVDIDTTPYANGLDKATATNKTDNDRSSPKRRKTKKLKSSRGDVTAPSTSSTAEGLSSEAKSNKAPDETVCNSSLITPSSMNSSSVHSRSHPNSNSKQSVSGQSDLYKTVSAWLPGCCSRYSNVLELVAPGRYGRRVVQDLLLMRFSRKRTARVKDGLEKPPTTLVEQAPEEVLYKRLIREQVTNTIDAVTEETSHSALHKLIHERFCITAKVSKLPLDANHWGRANDLGTSENIVLKDDKFDRRQLLVSFPDLFMERYPLPEHIYLQYRDNYIPPHRITPGDTKLFFENCVATKQIYAKVRSDSPLFGLDCEFVFTTGRVPSLGSISVVNEAGELLYHTLVKPKENITDYATRWSGITEKMLCNVTTTITDVQDHLRRHLPADAILVGHSLATDLRVMQMYHPYVVDTSLLYNLSGFKANRSKLKTLSKIFLQKDIQMVEKRVGHDPTEDAEAALQLVQLKLQHDHDFGNVITAGMMPSLSDATRVCLASHEKYFNMFESLQEYWEQSRQLPSSKPVRDQYVVLCPASLSSHWDGALQGLTKPEGARIMENNDTVINAVCDTAMINDAVIAHLEADPRLKSTKVKPRLAALSALDGQLTRVFDAAAIKALCCVIFAGASPPSEDAEGGPKDESNLANERLENGMLFFQIKGTLARMRKAAIRRLPAEAVDEKL